MPAISGVDGFFFSSQGLVKLKDLIKFARPNSTEFSRAPEGSE